MFDAIFFGVIIGILLTIIIVIIGSIQTSKRVSELKNGLLVQKNFTISQSFISVDGSSAVAIDENRKRIIVAIKRLLTNEPVQYKTFNYGDFIASEVIIEEGKNNVVARINLKLSFSDIKFPTVIIVFHAGNLNKTTAIYQEQFNAVHHWKEIFEVIKSQKDIAIQEISNNDTEIYTSQNQVITIVPSASETINPKKNNKYVKYIFFFLIVSFIAIALFYYINTNQQKRNTNSSNLASTAVEIQKLPIESVGNLFKKCLEAKERNPFETDEEYKKRQLQIIDTSKIYYFELEYEYNGINDEKYLYDIKKQKLILKGGNRPPSPPSYYSESEKFQSKGIQVKVSKDYIVSFMNLQSLPDSLYKRNKREFQVSTYISPKDAQDKIIYLVAMAGVKIIPNARCESNYSGNYFEAKLAELVIYNYSESGSKIIQRIKVN